MAGLRRTVLVAGVACGIMALNAGAADAALVGLYYFDNPADLGADSSGNGNDLVAFGSGVSAGTGLSGGGLSLTGSGGLTTASTDVPSDFSTGNSAYTIAVSFQTTAAYAPNGSNPMGLVGWGSYQDGGSGQTNGVRLLAPNDGGNYPGVDAFAWFNDLDASADVNNGAWQTLVTSYDGTTRDIYLNGVLVASDTPGTLAVTSGNFAIGETCPAGCDEGFIGTLDNVAIFDTALTPTEVDEAIPEPVSLAAFGTALLGLAAARRRKRC